MGQNWPQDLLVRLMEDTMCTICVHFSYTITLKGICGSVQTRNILTRAGIALIYNANCFSPALGENWLQNPFLRLKCNRKWFRSAWYILENERVSQSCLTASCITNIKLQTWNALKACFKVRLEILKARLEFIQIGIRYWHFTAMAPCKDRKY